MIPELSKFQQFSDHVANDQGHRVKFYGFDSELIFIPRKYARKEPVLFTFSGYGP